MLTYQFMSGLMKVLGMTPPSGARATDGDIVATPLGSIMSSTGEYEYGVVIGDIDKSEATDNYKIEDPVKANEPEHGETTIKEPETVASVTTIEIKRTFTNTSATTYTIREMGIAYYGNYLISRTISLSPISLEGGFSTELTTSLNLMDVFTINLAQIIYAFLSQNLVDMKNVAGSTQSNYNIHSNIDRCNIMAGVNETTYGILVGTGTDTFDGNNYALNDQNTVLNYGMMQHVNTSKAFNEEYCWMNFRRTFYNDTVNDIDITEIGIAVKGETTNQFLIYYLPITAVTVSSHSTLTVDITIKTSVDEIISDCVVSVPATESGTDMYGWVKNYNYIHKCVNADTYSKASWVEQGIDGEDIFIINGACYREAAGYETGRFLSPWMSGNARLNRLYSDKALDVTPILIGDRITGSPLTTTAMTIVPYARQAMPNLKADFIQLEIEPVGDFNLLTAEIQDGKK